MSALAAASWQVLAWTPPPPDGGVSGLRSALGEVAAIERSLASLTQAVTAMSAAPCFMVGFNLGGSLAALFAARHRVRGLVVAGSVPRLSSFWPRSAHPVAATVRKEAGVIDADFERLTRPFDLTTSLSTVSAPTLVQCGHRDAWLEGPALAELGSVPRVSLAWYDDDHAMMGAGARKAREDFLR